MKATDWAQLGFKRRVDPSGILNPGKMRAWEEGRATTAEVADPRGAFVAAYRVADTSAVGTAMAVPSDAATSAATAAAAATTTTAAAAAPGDAATPPRRPTSRLWTEWTTADFASADLTEAVAVLPIGAVEAHGPHLPLGVDAMHNAALLHRALAKLPTEATVLALPPMEVGVSSEHSGFAGTLELSAETAAAAWCDVAACVRRTGIRKLVLYNSHGGNHALAEVVARRLRQQHGMVCVLAMNLSCGMAPTSESASLFPDDEVRCRPGSRERRPDRPRSAPNGPQ